MDIPLQKAEKRIIRLATASADLASAQTAYGYYDACTDNDLNGHLLLSLVTCYARPFLARDGIGPLTDEYHSFPDFEDDAMNDRHFFFMALRNLFCAHTALSGVRLRLIPPTSLSSGSHSPSDRWRLTLGRRTFGAPEYKVHVRAAYPLIPALIARLEHDIDRAVQAVSTRHINATGPIEVGTGAQAFDLWQYITDQKKQHRDRQQSSPPH